MNAFMTYFVDPIKNHYLDFGGKATRTQYWAFVGWNILVYIACLIVSLILAKIASVLGTLVLAVYVLFELAILLPSLALAARRLRDGGFTPWLLFVALIPGLGGLILLVLFLMPSKN